MDSRPGPGAEVAFLHGPALPPPLVPARTGLRGGGYAALRQIALAGRGAPVVVGVAVHQSAVRQRGLHRAMAVAHARVLSAVPAAVRARAAVAAAARCALRVGNGGHVAGAAAL